MESQFTGTAKATMPAPPRDGGTSPALLQRKCACGGSPGVSGECEECQENLLQRKATTPSSLGLVPHSVSAALRAPGQPLDAATRANIWRAGSATTSARCAFTRMSGAADSARAVHALAYTVGRDVVFAPGQYAPNSAAGTAAPRSRADARRTAIAGGASVQPRLEIGAANDPAEIEADRVAAQVTSGERGRRQVTRVRSAGALAPPAREWHRANRNRRLRAGAAE